MKKIKIIGYSGHSYEILDILIKNDYTLEGYFDIKKKNLILLTLLILEMRMKKHLKKK